MPQSYDAGALFLAQVVIQNDELEALEVARVLNQLQIIKMRHAMEKAHRLRLIPAGSDKFLKGIKGDFQYDPSRAILIDDNRLHYIWNRFRERSIAVAKTLTVHSLGLYKVNQLVANFKDSRCRNLLKQYRYQYDRRFKGSDLMGALLRKQILYFVVSPLSETEQKKLLNVLLKS